MMTEGSGDLMGLQMLLFSIASDRANVDRFASSNGIIYYRSAVLVRKERGVLPLSVPTPPSTYLPYPPAHDGSRKNHPGHLVEMALYHLEVYGENRMTEAR